MRKRTAFAIALFAVAGCATEGTTTGGVGFYSDWYYMDDIWYGGGCCVDLPPDGVGPPRPEHPIVVPPGSQPRPENPIAPTPSPKASQPISSSPAPRPVATPRMGGGGGGRRR